MRNPSIKKNFIFSLFNQLIAIVIPLVVTPYTSRIFGADGIGINSYTTANVTYFMLFCMLGISGYGQRTIAIVRDNKEETSKVFCELQIIHFITFVLCSVAYFFLVRNSVDYKVYYIAQYTMLVSSFFDISWFYQAYERFDFIAIRNFFVKIAVLIAVFVFVHTKNDLVLFIFINGISTVISNLTLWFGLGKRVKKIDLHKLNLMRHMKDIMIFFIPTIAASVYSILDKSVINWVTHDASQNGYYEQAYKILQLCNVLVQTLSTVSAPRMSNVFANGSTEEFKDRLNKSLQFMLMISMPVAFGVCAIAQTFVPLFFGSGYDPVITILYVFMPLVVVLGFSVYLDGMYLVPSGKRLQSAMAVIVGSCFNLFLNFILVTYWGALGAAIATLLTEVLVSGIMIFLSKDMIEWRSLGMSMMKYLACSMVMFGIVFLISKIQLLSYVSLILQVACGVLSYFVILLILKDNLIMEYIILFKRKIKKKLRR
jgi:O-antigen/teichoic acid export membrane protein